jgi:hypothetical protein
VSYELKENLFLEISGQYRQYKTQINPVSTNSTIVTAGIRLNMFSRRYDF